MEIKESLLIMRDNPSLNRNINSAHLYQFDKVSYQVLSLFYVTLFNLVNDCMLLSCHVRVSEWIYTLQLLECHRTPCSKQALYLKFKWQQRDSNSQPLSSYKTLKKKLFIRIIWLIKWFKIQSNLLYVFSLILFIFSHLLCIQSHFICIQSTYIYSVSSYLYPLNLCIFSLILYTLSLNYVFSLILFIFSQLISIQSHLIYIHPTYMCSVWSYVFSLILFIFIQLICIQSHLIRIQSSFKYMLSHMFYVFSSHLFFVNKFSLLCATLNVENLIKICSFLKKIKKMNACHTIISYKFINFL